MSPKTRIQNASTTTRLIIASITSIIVSVVGAYGTQQALGQSGNNGLTRSEVRSMIKNEAPVNADGAAQLFTTLNRIDSNITDIKVNVAVGAANTRQLKVQVAEVLAEQRRVRAQLAKRGAR